MWDDSNGYCTTAGEVLKKQTKEAGFPKIILEKKQIQKNYKLQKSKYKITK